MDTFEAGSALLVGSTDELKALAKALAKRSPLDAGAAGAALLVKVLTGSSLAASAAEAAVAGPLGRFLADTPDARMCEATRVFVEEDENREALEAFASLVEERVQHALERTEAALAGIRAGQTSTGDAFDTLAHGMLEQLDAGKRIEDNVAALERVLTRLASATTTAAGANSARVIVRGDVYGQQVGNRSTQTNNFGDIIQPKKS